MRESDLLPISEFAKYSSINRATLIFYDKIGVLEPYKRNEKGYRFYSPQQIVVVNMINVLRALGFPLSKIGELMKRRDPESMLELFGQQSKTLMEEVHRLLSLYDIMFVFHHTISAGMLHAPGTIELREFEQTRVTLGNVNKFKKSESFYSEFLRYCDEAGSKGVNLAYPTGGQFKNFDDFVKEPNRPNRFYSQDGKGAHIIPAGRYLVGYTKGYYGETNGLEVEMRRYADERGLNINGPVYCLYLLDEVSVINPNDYLMRISVRVGGAEHWGAAPKGY